MSREDYCTELPEHLLYQVLLYLPVKTLIRFRSLSKEWNNTITSPSFARKHRIIHSKNKKRSDDHIYVHLYPDHVDHYVVTENITSEWSEAPNMGWPISLPPPISTLKFPGDQPLLRYYDCISSSSFHGLFAYRIYYECGPPAIMVWNPSMRQSRNVPWPPTGTVYAVDKYPIGICYDQVADDYKIVATDHKKMHIMSLKSNNIWRTIDTSYWDHFTAMSNSVTLDDGDIYWIGETYSSNICKVILKFNATSESLAVLPFPPEKNYARSHMKLGQYRGSLCLFVYAWDEPPNQYWANVWTLAGRTTTWNKLMNVPFFPVFRYPYAVPEPCGFTMSGDLIIWATYFLLIYFVREHKLVEPGVHHHSFIRTTLSLSQIETLISPCIDKY